MQKKYKVNIDRTMKDRNQMKRTYSSPLSFPTEVAFELALLVATARLLMEVDEIENVNADDPLDGESGSDMYFEF